MPDVWEEPRALCQQRSEGALSEGLSLVTRVSRAEPGRQVVTWTWMVAMGTLTGAWILERLEVVWKKRAENVPTKEELVTKLRAWRGGGCCWSRWRSREYQVLSFGAGKNLTCCLHQLEKSKSYYNFKEKLQTFSDKCSHDDFVHGFPTSFNMGLNSWQFLSQPLWRSLLSWRKINRCW